MSVTVGVASSVANDGHNENDVIMRTGAASAVGARCHNKNDVTMTIAGLWRYGDWRHVATGCTDLVMVKCFKCLSRPLIFIVLYQMSKYSVLYISESYKARSLRAERSRST